MPNETLGSRLSHAWNAFMGRDSTVIIPQNVGPASYIRPDKQSRPYFGDSSRSVVASIYNRIALDCASINIEHAMVDDDRNYVETLKSTGLNYCLTMEANLDQTSNDFMQDVVFSMFDEGVVAVVPIDTTLNPNVTGSYDVLSMRTAKILEWYPKHVKVSVYNENDGKHYDKIVPKASTAIITNPFYAVMNEPNSTLKRLLRVMGHIDQMNNQNASGKLDLLVQLPYSLRSDTKKGQAEERRKQIEAQLVDSKYGIAYIDSTEHITQLNRPLENNLWTQYTDLKTQLYNQLGLTEAIFNGTADEKTMLNYYSSTIDPILTVITKEMSRKFLTKNARTRGQTIWYFRDPFQLVPVDKIAEIADKFTRNEILSSNEVRSLIGKKPSSDPRADELRNSNMPDQDQGGYGMPMGDEEAAEAEGMEGAEPEEEIDIQEELRRAIEGE